MFPNLLSPISPTSIGDFIQDALQNGGGIGGGNIGDFIQNALQNGGGSLGDLLGSLLGGGVHAMHPQFPLGRQ